MRIGEVAEKAGVSVRALRYYEEQDLLRADRSPGGQRHYPDTAVARVRLIQQLYAAGLPSKVVRQVLPCVDSGEAPRHSWTGWWPSASASRSESPNCSLCATGSTK
ncbi:hypothetical protein GCM10010145_47520 [Streptomyces ruber]|uniref:HTH merR-type domain-containing protein n=2 Tax=Streptomyces TaxID=1883 RepID=A0A918BJ00_9ACTN|nr:hypothetical protein GCM10010145_47520 [Streptomyces ruber]